MAPTSRKRQASDGSPPSNGGAEYAKKAKSSATEADGSARPTLKGTVNEHLRCAICTDLMECPVGLRCGHSYCLMCVKQLMNTAEAQQTYSFLPKPKAKCPTCRSEIPDLPLVNLAIASIIDAALTGDTAELNRRLDLAVLGRQPGRVEALLKLRASPTAFSTHHKSNLNCVLWQALFSETSDNHSTDDHRAGARIANAGAVGNYVILFNASGYVFLRDYHAVIRKLLRQGVPPIELAGGKTPLGAALAVAKHCKLLEGDAAATDLETLCIEILNAGSSVSPGDGTDLVKLAAEACYHGVVEALVAKCAKVDITDKDVAFSMLQVWAKSHPNQVRKV